MFVKKCVIFFVIIFVTQKSGASGSRSSDLLQSLEYEEWSDDETHCKDATIALLEGVKNNTLWASWIWDSMQQPVGALYGSRYHLGNFDQCLEAPWTQPWPTQYCLVDVKLTDQIRPYEGEVKNPYGNVENFVGMETRHGRQLSWYSIGVCLPSVCSPSSVAKISRNIHQLSHLPLSVISVEQRNCQVKEEKPYSFGFYAFWFIILSSVTISTVVYFVEDLITQPKLKEAANWFSPTKNFEALTKVNQDELSSLNGIRCLSAGCAITMHYFYYVAGPSAMNAIDIGKDIESPSGKIVIQLALVIDTFFVMSGLLTMKGLLTNNSNPVKMLWKRYLRLLAPFAMSLLYMSAVLPYTVSGPLWPKLMKEQAETCAKNWWLGPLMLNNYIRSEAICHTVTWYLSCDYQLTIFGTVLFCLCQKLSKSNAVKMFSTTFLLSMIIPGVMTYMNQLPAVFLYDIEGAGDVKLNKVFLTTYMKAQSRASAYMIGLALGYLIHLYKPMDYRKKIPKTWSIFGGILGFGILVSDMALGGTFILREYNAFEVTLYSMLDRSIWAIGVCCLILVTEYGTFPIVGDFFSSKSFTALSRLSYNVYLFHPALLFKIFYSTRTPVTYSFFHHVLDGFGYIAVAALVSYLLWFIVEAPMVNITISIFKNRKNKTTLSESTQNGSIKKNDSTIYSKNIVVNGKRNGITNQVNNGILNCSENFIKNGAIKPINGTQNGSIIHAANGTQNGSTIYAETGTSHDNGIQNGSTIYAENGTSHDNGTPYGTIKQVNGKPNGTHTGIIHAVNGTQDGVTNYAENGTTKNIEDFQLNGVSAKKNL